MHCSRRPAQLLLAASLLAIPTLLTACGEEDKTPSAADTTTPSPGAGPALTTEALLTDADTVYSDGADWFRTGTGQGDGRSAFHPCAEQALAGTGATSVVRGDYELRNSEPGAPEVGGDSLVQVVARYDDAAATTAAWSTVTGWLERCATRPAELTDYRALQTRKVAVPGTDAVITDSHLGPVAKELDPSGDAAYIMETGVLRKGTTLVVLTSVIVGQDYDFVDGTPVERMLPKAAARL